MLHTFTKKGVRGFTLIELLVVIAIIGLLSTIITAPIQNARKKAKDVKKVAELKAIQSALNQYAEANAQYPATLADLAPQYMTKLPSFVGNATVRDRVAYVVYTGTPTSGVAVRYGYHLGIHLDVFTDTLRSDADCTGAVNGVTITADACTWFNGPTTYSYPDYIAGMPGTNTTSDFDDGNDADTTCAAPTSCIFDITDTF